MKSIQETFRKIRIFVASPGDVQSEREQLVKVINELNLTISAIAPEKRIILELVRWETHVAPGADVDPQKVVSRQIGSYDIFIGILWKRMGTPTTSAISGTAEEFEHAYTLWLTNKTLPILMYFCQQPFSPPVSLEEVKQLEEMVRFRDKLGNSGLLIAYYPFHEGFDDVIRPHLLLVLGKLLAEDSSGSQTKKMQQLTSGPNSSASQEQLYRLARDYDNLRENMPSGDDRTSLMSIIVTQMRALVLSTNSLLPKLIASESAGRRLAAVALLQSLPDVSYLDWMADRLRVEMPFIRYQIAQAMLIAVRILPRDNYDKLIQVLKLARENLKLSPHEYNDQMDVLIKAENELSQLNSLSHDEAA